MEDIIIAINYEIACQTLHVGFGSRVGSGVSLSTLVHLVERLSIRHPLPTGYRTRYSISIVYTFRRERHNNSWCVAIMALAHVTQQRGPGEHKIVFNIHGR